MQHLGENRFDNIGLYFNWFKGNRCKKFKILKKEKIEINLNNKLAFLYFNWRKHQYFDIKLGFSQLFNKLFNFAIGYL